MKISELIEALSKYPEDLDVFGACSDCGVYPLEASQLSVESMMQCEYDSNVPGKKYLSWDIEHTYPRTIKDKKKALVIGG